MKYKLVTLFCLCFAGLSAQTISSSVISSAGSTQANSQVSASWTLGEPVTELMTNQGLQLSSGFHSQLNLEALSVLEPNLKVSIKVYPNPASEYLNIHNTTGKHAKLTVYSQSGQEVLNKELNTIDSQISLQGIASGVYIVNIETDSSSKFNSYKIIKN